MELNMPVILCGKCRRRFEPDLQTRGPWICPHCRAKNANLKRHYRAIADLCILGLCGFAAFLYFGTVRLNLFSVLFAADAVLLLVTTVAIFKSRAPWASATVQFLIWATFVIAFLFNVGIPLFSGRLVISPLVIYAMIFPYLFWLN
jgi:hypothetical protein